MPDDHTFSDRLLIVGASARAAAASAVRHGTRVFALDLFADTDLCQIAHVQRIGAGYPHRAIELAAELPEMPWMYTGGIENHVQLIRQLTAVRPLLGNAARTVQRVRDPFRLAAVARGAGFCFPETQDRPPSPCPSADAWLVKRLRSCGGNGVWRLSDPQVADQRDGRAFVWQRRVEGTACSAAYVSDRHSCRLLGVTRQLLAGQHLLGTVKAQISPFAYVGSIGPLPLNDPTRRQWEALGKALTTAFQLVGVFGVDAIAAAGTDAPLTLIEVNPRYTASMELIEMAIDRSVFQLHLDACRGQGLPAPRPSPVPGGPSWEKRYVFANEPTTVTAEFVRHLQRAPELTNGRPSVADIPRIGTRIAPGHPVHTRFLECKSHSRPKTCG